MFTRTVTRRSFLTVALGALSARRVVSAQQTSLTQTMDMGQLTIAYEDSGNTSGFPVILLHGFPDDVHAYDEVVPLLVKNGCRTIVPYLRGFGPTSRRHLLRI